MLSGTEAGRSRTLTALLPRFTPTFMPPCLLFPKFLLSQVWTQVPSVPRAEAFFGILVLTNLSPLGFVFLVRVVQTASFSTPSYIVLHCLLHMYAGGTWWEGINIQYRFLLPKYVGKNYLQAINSLAPNMDRAEMYKDTSEMGLGC